MAPNVPLSDCHVRPRGIGLSGPASVSGQSVLAFPLFEPINKEDGFTGSDAKVSSILLNFGEYYGFRVHLTLSSGKEAI
jgi:hypothetical protein